DQFAFLHAMGSYLSLFRESIAANEITVEFGTNKSYKFALDANKPFQMFSVAEELPFPAGGTFSDEGEALRFSSNLPQPLFVEFNWREKELQVPPSLSRGISLYQDLSQSTPLFQGEELPGTLTIISPRKYNRVVLVHPQVTGSTQIFSDEHNGLWSVKDNGGREYWYFFEHLPEGKTSIPFSWKLNFSGDFEIPPATIFVSNDTSIFASSNRGRVKVGVRP
ncbi:MAG: hypothetical protein Q8P95_02995, partial [bacterium]|nr:hypothetical protein [bacterium]